MRPSLILVAAGGLARETLEAVRAAGTYDVIGLVDDDPARWGELVDGVKILGGLDVVHDHPNAAALLCAGKGMARESIAARLDLDDARYATVVHPSAVVGRTCTVAAGSIVLAGCVLTSSVTLGRHVVTMPNVTLTHDNVVADFATLCAGAVLGGSATVGERAYLGMSVCVREKVTVGPDAIAGMGSVVLCDIPGGEVWVGNPARALGPASTRRPA